MEQIWWERVPNALAFTTDVVEDLLKEKSIVLKCEKEFPWYSYMTRNIKESVKQQNSSKRFENVNCEDNPGAYLLKEFCKAGKRADYRPTKTYARFFAESDDIVLHERYFWVKINEKKQMETWLKFVSEYIKERGRNKDTAVFILEWIGSKAIPTKKGIKSYSLDDYISDYDRIVFCTLAASSVKERAFIKNYLMELTSIVIGNDIELCAKCLEDYRGFLNGPYETILKIVESKIRSDGSEFTFRQNSTDVKHSIWLAQIRTVYPWLEEYREEFVKQYSSAIEKQLPMTSSYGEIYTSPNDVELGTLKYMADNGRLNLSPKEYDKLKLNREARNKLSHLVCLTIEEIKELDV